MGSFDCHILFHIRLYLFYNSVETLQLFYYLNTNHSFRQYYIKNLFRLTGKSCTVMVSGANTMVILI